MIRKITIITLCLAALAPTTVNAQAGNLNSPLRGDYSFSGEQTCIGSGTGFSGFDAQPPAYSTSASVESIHRFNGDGTGTAVGGRQVSINNNGGNTTVLGPASVSTFSLEFTYTVALDHSIHIANGPTATTQIVGPRAGTQEATIISTGTSYDGYVAEDFRTITV